LNFLISNIITIPEHLWCLHSTVDSALPRQLLHALLYLLHPCSRVPRYFVPLPLASVSKSVPDRFIPHIHVFHPEGSATSPEDARAYLIVYITKRANSS